jgi:hypothetical protein
METLRDIYFFIRIVMGWLAIPAFIFLVLATCGPPITYWILLTIRLLHEYGILN